MFTKPSNTPHRDHTELTEARTRLHARLLAADRQAEDPAALLELTSVFDRIREWIARAEA